MININVKLRIGERSVFSLLQKTSSISDLRNTNKEVVCIKNHKNCLPKKKMTSVESNTGMKYIDESYSFGY